MADEYDSADSDTVEDVVSAAADKLGVDSGKYQSTRPGGYEGER